jgi:hypothetical protein
VTVAAGMRRRMWTVCGPIAWVIRVAADGPSEVEDLPQQLGRGAGGGQGRRGEVPRARGGSVGTGEREGPLGALGRRFESCRPD